MKEIDQKTMENIIDHIFNKIKDRNLKQQEYIKSGGLDDDLKIVKDFFEKHPNVEVLDNADLRYDDDGTYPFNEEKLCDIVDTVFSQIAEKSKTTSELLDVAAPFGVYSFKYEGFIFRIGYGQGTSMQIWK